MGRCWRRRVLKVLADHKGNKASRGFPVLPVLADLLVTMVPAGQLDPRAKKGNRGPAVRRGILVQVVRKVHRVLPAPPVVSDLKVHMVSLVPSVLLAPKETQVKQAPVASAVPREKQERRAQLVQKALWVP